MLPEGADVKNVAALDNKHLSPQIIQCFGDCTIRHVQMPCCCSPGLKHNIDRDTQGAIIAAIVAPCRIL